MEAARYHNGEETIVIQRCPNGKYYNHYGYNDGRQIGDAGIAGGFDTFEEAEAMVFRHRPRVEKEQRGNPRFRYRISADSGNTWTEQYLSETEAEAERATGHICERVSF